MTETMLGYIYYGVYLSITFSMIVIVGSILHKRGRVFILDTFNGDDIRADSVNTLLLVGFYLINVGFIMYFISSARLPNDSIEFIKYLCNQIGLVSIILGAMHFFNIYNLNKMRKRAK